VTYPTSEVCSEGHPLVVRLGRNGPFLSCSTFPDHKESRPVPAGLRIDGPCVFVGEDTPSLDGEGEPCPECGEGVLVTKRGRFGTFMGCSRYPDCRHIRKDGPPPPDQLPFPVLCPKHGDGPLTARRARRTGNVFWGCSKYPKCDFTTNDEPTGAVHDAHDDGKGAVARKGDAGLCLTCGAAVVLPEGDLVGARLPGGPPDPAALERPARAGGRRGGARTGGSPRRTGRAAGTGTRSGAGARKTRA
jgi:ssDNA-binding Zn-finger/Zn-ribbon topoisomerase 1